MERPIKDANGFFYEFKQLMQTLKESFKGSFLRLILIILMVALPIAAVDSYSTNIVASSVLAILPTIDFTSQSSIESLLTTASLNTPTGFASTALTLIVSLLQCAVFVIASVYTWQRIRNKNNYLGDSTAFAKLILRKLPVAFVISYLSSYLLTTVLQICVMSLSVFLLVPVLIISIPLFLITAFALYCIFSAAIDSYASVMLSSCAIGRVRFLASMYYARLLYKGSFFKTAAYFALINAATSLIGLIPMGVALYLSYIQSPASYFVWVASGIVQCLLAGLSMCFFTARMLQLEQKNMEHLRPHSFIVLDEDEQYENEQDNGQYYG